MLPLHIMIATATIAVVGLLLVAEQAHAFQIPHARHHHPIYVQYRQQLEQDQQPHSQMPSPSDIVTAHSTAMAISEEKYSTAASDYSSNLLLASSYQRQEQSSHIVLDLNKNTDVSISTPISYDEETGMVQTAVRAIVKHSLSSLVDNNLVGISSTLVIATGALHETIHCLELELTHHATAGSTESLAILSIGHFFHYGREAIRQLAEMYKEEEEGSKDDIARP